MAKINLTQVVNGIVQPRMYQVYGDLIESKEVMEPISIVAGSGPICGFDFVDTTQPNLTIKSIWGASENSQSNSFVISQWKERAKRVFISTKENVAGQVHNAYTTPDGLVFIAPDTLVFEGVVPPGGWPNLSIEESGSSPTEARVFCLIASHSYVPNDSQNPPSVADFRVHWLPNNSPILNLINWNFEKVLSFLTSNGVTFDPNTDVLIGIYSIGWDSSWMSEGTTLLSDMRPYYFQAISAMGFRVCINPYGGKLPMESMMVGPLDSYAAITQVSGFARSIKSLTDTTIRLQGEINEANGNITKVDDRYRPLIPMNPTKVIEVDINNAESRNRLFTPGAVHLIYNDEASSQIYFLDYTPEHVGYLEQGDSFWLIPRGTNSSGEQKWKLTGISDGCGKFLNTMNSQEEGSAKYVAYEVTCLYRDKENPNNNIFLNRGFEVTFKTGTIHSS